MDADVTAYLETAFAKLRQIKANEKGEVWLAADVSGKLVIVKHIFLTGLPYQALKELAPNICPHIYQCIEDEAETVVVEEFVPGESLAERMREKGCLTEDEGKDILLQLCDGLAPIHTQKIIHRDIKPSNLIVQPGGRIRLIDFDAARTIKENSREDTKLLGTKGYAPPEQFGYGQTDARSDIYAIGVTMQKMLGNNCDSLSPILHKCTQLDPQQRYASVASLKRAILWQSRRKYLAAACALLLLAVVYGNSASKRQSADKPTAAPEMSVSAPAAEPTVTEPPAAEPLQTEETAVTEPDKPTTLPVAESLPEHSAPTRETEAVLPAPIPSPPTEQVPTGNISANLYLNGTLFDKLQYEFNLPRTEWQNQNAVLHLENNSNIIWEQPTMRIIFSDNWGQKQREEQVLPPLAPHESTDYTIHIADFNPNDQPDTSVWVQIYLDKSALPHNESYWCINYTLDE